MSCPAQFWIQNADSDNHCAIFSTDRCNVHLLSWQHWQIPVQMLKISCMWVTCEVLDFSLTYWSWSWCLLLGACVWSQSGGQICMTAMWSVFQSHCSHLSLSIRIRGSSPSSCGSSPLNITSTPPPDTCSPGGKKVTRTRAHTHGFLHKVEVV